MRSALLLIGLTTLSSAILTRNAPPLSEIIPFQAGANSIFIAVANSTFNSTACATGIHMIVARASTEKPGQGIIGAVATQVQQQVPGSDSEAVEYPATLTDYQNSEASGVAAMTKLVQSYAARCPSTKIALLGYSQGAQVVGDVMCGTSEASFNSTKAISAAATKNIVAIIQMGDPSHMINQPQDVGNSTKNGIFPRNNTGTACKSMEGITQSYCNADDKFCDSGTSVAVHVAYVQGFGTAATNFIVKKALGNASLSTSGIGTPTGSNTTGTSSTSSTVPRSDAKRYEGVSWGLLGGLFILILTL